MPTVATKRTFRSCANMVPKICPLAVPLVTRGAAVFHILLLSCMVLSSLADIQRTPPRFSNPPTNKEVMPGGSVNLTCVAVGSPVPYVNWIMGPGDLTRGEEIPQGRNVLQLTNIKESANYTCVAMSSLGVIMATAQITVKALPIPPTSLAVTKTTATSVTLTWDYEDDEPLSYYMIQYKSKTSGSFHEVRGVLTLHYSLDGLSPNTDYQFRVLAVNEFGHGPPSNPVETRTGERTPPSSPLRVQARMLSASIMLVQWEPLQEPNVLIRGYRVYYSADQAAPLSEWQQRNTDDSSVIAISGLIPNVAYSLRVLGFTSGGDGPPSDILQVKTQQEAPPTQLEVEALNSTAIRVTWKAPLFQHGQIRGYQVVYSRLENGELQGQPSTLDVALSEAQEVIIGGLQSETTYSVTVAAYTSEGYGARSKAKVITTTGGVPGKPNMSVTVTGSIAVIYWLPPEDTKGDLIGYKLQYKRTDDENFTSHEFRSTNNLHVITGLHQGATYIFILNAYNRAGIGEPIIKQMSINSSPSQD